MVLIKAPNTGKDKLIVIENVNISKDQMIDKGHPLMVLRVRDNNEKDGRKEKLETIKSECAGKVLEVFVKKGLNTSAGSVLVHIGTSSNSSQIHHMNTELGLKSQNMDIQNGKEATEFVASGTTDFAISNIECKRTSSKDEQKLLESRRLVLLVDLDLTLVHTTYGDSFSGMQDVYTFQLGGPESRWFQTRVRPNTSKFLENISKLFELHIITYGAREYAHKIAEILDPVGQYFSDRIISRDECIDTRSKTANLASLFPFGDHMVCIIDDRKDVWDFATNMIHVKPYKFFKNVEDINEPQTSKPQDIIKTESDNSNTIVKEMKSDSKDLFGIRDENNNALKQDVCVAMDKLQKGGFLDNGNR